MVINEWLLPVAQYFLRNLMDWSLRNSIHLCGNHSSHSAADWRHNMLHSSKFFFKPWITQNLVSRLSLSSGMAVWQWWVSSLALVPSYWLVRASCIKLVLVENMQEPDVWAPEGSSGYYRLFFFGSFVAALGVGANKVGHYLWASVQAMNNFF